MSLKKLMAVLIAASMALSMTACGGGEKTPAEGGSETKTEEPAGTEEGGSETTDSTEAKVDPDGYYNSYMGAEPASLDPGKASDIYSHYIMIDMLEPLVRLDDRSGKNEYSPAGAESWTTSDDGLVWTFKLRDNTWSDGVAVTAKDYEYAIKRTANPETGSPNSFFLSCIKNANKVMASELSIDELGVKAIDDKTLEFTLEQPTPWFLSLTYQKAMMPQRQDIVEKHGERYGSEADTLVSNGPFMLTDWTHNNQIVMEKNPSYWDKDSVKLSKVDWKILADENAQLNSLDNGSLDSVTVQQKEWLDRFSKRDDMSYITYAKPMIVFNFYNNNDPVVGNANIRKALTLGVDRDEFNEVVYKGVNEPAYGWVPPAVDMGSLGEYRSLVEEPIKKLEADNPDPKALLLKGMEELGLGSDPSTITIKLAVGGTDQWYRTYGEYLQQAYKTSLGINLEIQFYEWGTFMSHVESGDYQVGNMSWTIDYNEPMNMLELMKTGSNAIITNWSNPAYDELIVQASLEQDESKRMELYQKAEMILLYDDCIITPQVYTKTSVYRYNYLKGLPTNTFSTYGMGLKYAYTSGR